MPKMYVTFGQVHAHNVDGVTFDKDCVAAIEAPDAVSGRQKAFDLFGPKFCFTYYDDQFSHEEMLPYFPRGIIEVEP